MTGLKLYHSIAYSDPDFNEFETNQDRLVILVQEDLLQYAVMSPEGQLRVCKEMRNDQRLSQGVFYRFVFESEKLLSRPFASKTFVSCNSLYTFIPEGYEKAHVNLARILIDDSVFEDEVVTAKVGPVPAHVIFPVSDSIRHIFDDYLKEYQMSHISVLDASLADQLSKEHPELILLHVMEGNATITAYKNSRLHLSNSFSYRAETDILYFIQSVKKVLMLDDQALPIFVMGNVDRHERLYQTLSEYLPGLSLPKRLKEHSRALNEDFPYWRYAYMAV